MCLNSPHANQRVSCCLKHNQPYSITFNIIQLNQIFTPNKTSEKHVFFQIYKRTVHMLPCSFCYGTISPHSINTLYHLCASVPPLVARKGSAVLSTSLAPCATLPFSASPGRSPPARCALQNASPLSHPQCCRTGTRQSIHTAYLPCVCERMCVCF